MFYFFLMHLFQPMVKSYVAVESWFYMSWLFSFINIRASNLCFPIGPFQFLQNLCSICLDPLNYDSGQAIFTAQCSHAFHFSCISSNVRHGSVTCPTCRARWTQLPRNLNTSWSIRDNKTDPVLQILDEYIANSREHRRSFLLHSSHYDDVPDHTSDHNRLDIISTPSYPGLLLAPNSWMSSCLYCGIPSNHLSSPASTAYIISKIFPKKLSLS